MSSSLTTASFAHDDSDDTTLSPLATTFYKDVAMESDEDTDQAEQDNASEETEDEALGAILSRHIFLATSMAMILVGTTIICCSAIVFAEKRRLFVDNDAHSM